MTTREDVQTRPVARTSLGAAINAFETPAYLLSGGGAVVFCNDAAKQRYDAPPGWLSSVPTDPEAESVERLARVRSLDLAGQTLYLVLPRTAGVATDGGDSVVNLLPPSLRRVCEMLLAGLSDREIAERSDLTPSSARTYVARIYRKLGVRSRGELFALEMSTRRGE